MATWNTTGFSLCHDDASFAQQQAMQLQQQQQQASLQVQAGTAPHNLDHLFDDPWLEVEEHDWAMRATEEMSGRTAVTYHDLGEPGVLDPDEVIFHRVDYQSAFQPRTAAARMEDDEPVSPGTIPGVEKKAVAEHDAKLSQEEASAEEVKNVEEAASEQQLLWSVPHAGVETNRTRKRRAAFAVANEKITKRLRKNI